MNLTILIIFLRIFLHPFHVSVCEINHDQKTNALQITHRIFIDDMENALNKAYDVQLDIMNPDDPDQITKLIGKYVIDRFKITVDHKVRNLIYIGYELDEDAIWCYMEIKGISGLEEIEVFNTILFETYDDQSNIIHVKYQGKIKSFRLMGDTKSSQLSF